MVNYLGKPKFKKRWFPGIIPATLFNTAEHKQHFEHYSKEQEQLSLKSLPEILKREVFYRQFPQG